MSLRKTLIFLICFLYGQCITSQEKIYPKDIETGAQQTSRYYPLIKDKNVAVVSNHTSMIGEMHLVDKLLDDNINLVKVFSPEHGFRGKAGAGEKIESNTDPLTGLPVVSLYGSNRKPKTEDLRDIDVVLFDIQDVGARVYTYISTMTYVMEACADEGIAVIVLDRPNPNGHYVDGPVLDKQYSSFVGLHPVPLVHGMTIGEYAQMVNNEGWLNSRNKCDLTIIPVKGYDHKKLYQLPEKPSPNLPNMNSVYLYPSLVLFEGTIISIGRGTDHPFETIGHPDYYLGSFAFTPESRGEAKNPKHKGTLCTGISLINYTKRKPPHSLNLNWLTDMYSYFSELWVDSETDQEFFNAFFNKLAGNSRLKSQIQSGKSAEEIRLSWQEKLREFKKIRAKYLLYPDFE